MSYRGPSQSLCIGIKLRNSAVFVFLALIPFTEQYAPPLLTMNPQFIKLAEVFSLRGGAQLEVSRHQWLRLVGPHHKDFEILGFRV